MVVELVPHLKPGHGAGDPRDLAADVGLVIDREAFDGIQTHLLRLQRERSSEFLKNQPAAPLA
jgi:RHH-type proline utilization regulon transcriptional repressor/proline dehydrogenase/delta 1-pyrroline-5-carboxylate dehydrogenase